MHRTGNQVRLALALLLPLIAAAGCTDNEFINPGNVHSTLGTTTSNPGNTSYDCVLLDIGRILIDPLDGLTPNPTEPLFFTNGAGSVNFASGTCAVPDQNPPPAVLLSPGRYKIRTLVLGALQLIDENPNADCAGVGNGNCTLGAGVCLDGSNCTSASDCPPDTCLNPGPSGICATTYAPCMDDSDCVSECFPFATCEDGTTFCSGDANCTTIGSGRCMTGFCSDLATRCDNISSCGSPIDFVNDYPELIFQVSLERPDGLRIRIDDLEGLKASVPTPCYDGGSVSDFIKIETD